MKKLYLLILMCIVFSSLLIVSVDARVHKQDAKADLTISCFNNGTICSNSAECNITVINPDGSVLVDNKLMTNQITYFNYTLSATQTASTGTYNVISYCKDGTFNGYTTPEFIVTPNGEELNEGTAIFYIGAIAVLLFLIILGVLGFVHGKDTWKKALAFGLVWIMFVALNYIFWVGSYNYLYDISFLHTFFWWAFQIQLIATFPLFIGYFLYYIWMVITIKPIKHMLETGVPEDRAYQKLVRKDTRKRKY